MSAPYFHLLKESTMGVPSGSTFTFTYDWPRTSPRAVGLVAGNSEMTCGNCGQRINAGEYINMPAPHQPVTHEDVCVLRFKR